MKFTLCHFRPYGARCALFGLLTVLSVLFTMATALSVTDFLQILFGSDLPVNAGGNLVTRWLDGLYRWLISFGQLSALLLFSGIIFVLYSLKNVFTYWSKVEISIVRTRVVRDLRNQMFHRAMRLPLSYFDHNRKGDVLSRFSADMVEYEENTINSIQSLAAAAVSMVLYLAMLFYLNVPMTLFVLLMLPIIGGVISGLARRLKRQSKEVQEMSSRLVSMTDETIGGLKVIKSYTAIDFSNERFRLFNREFTRRRTSMYRRIMLASPLSDFLGNVVVIGILLFGSYLIFAGGGLTPSLFISYIMLFVLMIPPAKELATAVSQMKKGRACADRIEEFLNVPAEPDASAASPVVFSDSAPLVEFSNVSFAYDDDIPVLCDISFSVPRGSTVALVGSSGSGKSTVADLLCRFYSGFSGQISFAGVPLEDIPLVDLRSRIGVVAQETLLFNDTVRANIAFGRPGASGADIEAAARAAQAHDFISALPQGYLTNLGEGGSLLSGGQQQRISIARALLRNPDLLILDEATSALDTQSERLLQQTLDTLLSRHTALVIAHRLSTIRNADLILVLDGGKIVERGTHDQLMALGGRYAELVALQSIK